MSRAMRLVGVAGVVLGLAGTAAAGPIGWSYSGVVEAPNGGPWVHFGAEEKDWYDPATGESGVTPYQILGQIDATFSGSESGPGTARLASYDVTNLHSYPIDDEWALNRPNWFQVRLTIRDEVSGEWQELEYDATGASAGFFLTGTGVVNLSVDSRADVFHLGDYTYTVQARVRESESAAHIELDVDMVHNPEPGTLALAGMGLAGTLGWRVRRRR